MKTLHTFLSAIAALLLLGGAALLGQRVLLSTDYRIGLVTESP